MSLDKGQQLRLTRGFLLADKIWQAATDVAVVNQLMKSPAFRGLFRTNDFVPSSLRRKRMLPLLPKGPDDPRIEQFAQWFLEGFKEVTGCWDGSSLPLVQEFERSSQDSVKPYLSGQLLATSQPEVEYWEGYAIRKGVTTPHAWNRLAGKVLDMTWFRGKGNAETVYLGVPVPTDFLKWCQASPHPVAYLYWAKLKQDGKV